MLPEQKPLHRTKDSWHRSIASIRRYRGSSYCSSTSIQNVRVCDTVWLVIPNHSCHCHSLLLCLLHLYHCHNISPDICQGNRYRCSDISLIVQRQQRTSTSWPLSLLGLFAFTIYPYYQTKDIYPSYDTLLIVFVNIIHHFVRCEEVQFVILLQ